MTRPVLAAACFAALLSLLNACAPQPAAFEGPVVLFDSGENGASTYRCAHNDWTHGGIGLRLKF